MVGAKSRIENIAYRIPAMIRYWTNFLKDHFGTQQYDFDKLRFTCNLCGRENKIPLRRLTREEATCSCGSTVRSRALINVLSKELFGFSYVIADMPLRQDIFGIDMSGMATYSDRLVNRLGYMNTYLHKKPQLDIVAPGSQWLGRCDFVISSDVFEHVTPPVSRAFGNALRLLKPGGVLILTVPYSKMSETIEHFPDLHDYRIEVRDGKRILLNITVDGESEEFDDLVFHGGAGHTLEMRVFSESGLLGELQRAGFTDIHIYNENCLDYGIFWKDDTGVPVTARRPLYLGVNGV